LDASLRWHDDGGPGRLRFSLQLNRHPCEGRGPLEPLSQLGRPYGMPACAGMTVTAPNYAPAPSGLRLLLWGG
jgi:hypothetical protein